MAANACQKGMEAGLPNGKRTAAVHVLGCKVNQAEAAAIVRILTERDYVVDRSAEDPDVVVVNTCCVTAKAEGKSRRLVGRLAERYPSARFVVVGCLAEINAASLGTVAPGAVVMGNPDRDRLEACLVGDMESPCAAHGLPPVRKHFEDLGAAPIPGRARAFLKVQDGCSQRCSYCIVPRSRGPSRSLPLERALEHAGTLESAGAAEIVLTGIHLGSYGRDLPAGIGLPELVYQLLAHCSSARFRLSSIEPQEITPEVLNLTAREPRVCRHFHIPLQSGHDEILRRMGRPYRRTFMKELLGSIQEQVPDVCVGLDIMVGFPGEDEQSFEATRDLILESGAAYLHVFPFSARPGTPAAAFTPRVPEAVAQRRVRELRELSASLRKSFCERFIGRTLTATAESETDSRTGMTTARTDNYLEATVAGVPPEALRTAFSVRIAAVSDTGVEADYVE